MVGAGLSEAHRTGPGVSGSAQACAQASESRNLTADDTDPALISHGVEAGAVTLASSRDPVLAAFGRAVLGEPGVPHPRLPR
jgi:hypothetical protein